MVGIPFGVCGVWWACGWVGGGGVGAESLVRRSRGCRSACSGGRFARGVRAWWECVRGRACVWGCGCGVGCYSPGGL